MQHPIIFSTDEWKAPKLSKSILLDTDAIISLLAYDVDFLMDKFIKDGITLHIIHPAYIELLKTENLAERIKRQAFLSKYNVVTLPMLVEQLNHARDIQTWLVENKYFKASVVDLYLGGTLMKYNKSGLFLLTGNISDFPEPLFRRSANILLQNNNSGKVLYLLKVNENELHEEIPTPDDIPF